MPQVTPSATEFQMMRTGGIGSMRFLISWPRAQDAASHAFEWRRTDELVGAAAREGIQVSPILIGTPRWATGCTGNQDRCERTPPVGSKKAERGWKAFVAAAVDRYGPGGDFWNEPGHDFDPVPITTWQIWNEMNLPTYWQPKPSVKGYAKLLDMSASVIRRHDPTAKIVLGGMNGDGGGSRNAITGWNFLGKLYGIRGTKADFDAAAIHPYDATATGAIKEIKRLREVLTRHHDGGAGLWVTEIGWSSDGGHSTVSTNVLGQAKQLRNAFSALITERNRWNVQRVFWYSWRDRTDAVCDWCGRSGLVDRNLLPKPAWLVYQHFAAGLPIPKGLFK